MTRSEWEQQILELMPDVPAAEREAMADTLSRLRVATVSQDAVGQLERDMRRELGEQS